MYDIHTHTFLSDGVLSPAEMVRRCQVVGYSGLVIADHVGPSNLDFVLDSLCEFCEMVAGAYEGVDVLPGCELTHVPPVLIPRLIDAAREAGAEVVLVHGETLAEPVAPGTNRAAIDGGTDVIAHPGLITEEEVQMAADAGIMLEVTGRKGHSLTNGHVARLALAGGAMLSYGSDGHAPGDYRSLDSVRRVLRGAGLSGEQVLQVLAHNESFFTGDEPEG